MSMTGGHCLTFRCVQCCQNISLSLQTLSSHRPLSLRCSDCSRIYDFNDPDLQRQLLKFMNLCAVLRDSEEILSDASVGVDVGPHQVQIPFRLLLTRLGATLDLSLEDEQCRLSFRFEPSAEAWHLQPEETTV